METFQHKHSKLFYQACNHTQLMKESPKSDGINKSDQINKSDRNQIRWNQQIGSIKSLVKTAVSASPFGFKPRIGNQVVVSTLFLILADALELESEIADICVLNLLNGTSSRVTRCNQPRHAFPEWLPLRELTLHPPSFLPGEVLGRFVSTNSLDVFIPKSPQQLRIAAELGWFSIPSCFHIFPPIPNLHFFCSTPLARTCIHCDGGVPSRWSS